MGAFANYVRKLQSIAEKNGGRFPSRVAVSELDAMALAADVRDMLPGRPTRREIYRAIKNGGLTLHGVLVEIE